MKNSENKWRELFNWFFAGITARDKAAEASRLIEQGNNWEDEEQPDLALECYEKSISLIPNFARGHLNRGNALFAKGETSEALAAYSTALTYEPTYAQAHCNAGNVHRRLGNINAAMTSYLRALELKPDLAGAEMGLGCALHDLGDLCAAEKRYRRAIAIQPDFAEAHSNLGDILVQQENLELAAESYHRANEISPDKPLGYIKLAKILIMQRKVDSAVSACKLAFEKGSRSLEATSSVGRLFFELGEFQYALESFQRALALAPDHAENHHNLGYVMHTIGRTEDAIYLCRKAVELDPQYALAYATLANALASSGHLDAAEESFREAMKLAPHLSEIHSSLLFHSNLRSDKTAAQMLDEAVRFGRFAAQKACRQRSWANDPDPERSLRIGLVSSDLRTHPVAYFLEGALAALSSSAAARMEFIAYCGNPCDDETSKRLQSCCRDWVLVDGLPDEALAQRIRADRIDILVDLSGHTSNNRLPMFAWKPAPIQVTWLGYFATTGVAEMDYLIADSWTVPEREEMYFTEVIWRLPETRLCFTTPNVEVDAGPLPAITTGFVTFGCFNNLSKVTDDVIQLWSRVLLAVPKSRLFLKSLVLQETSVQKGIVARFAKQGIAPGQLILEGGSSRSKYLATYHRVDIALDPFPYPGGATTAEALWMGVPVLTLAGDSFLSRQGRGLLMNAGLPEWVAQDQDDYVAKAVKHAGDLDGLAALRGQLRQRVSASPIFDGPRFARHLEAALRGMWKIWCNKNQPRQVSG